MSSNGGRARTNTNERAHDDDRMSERLWGLDWLQREPIVVGEYRIVPGLFEDAAPFMQEHYARLFETDDPRFLKEPMSEAKIRFCWSMDFLLVKRAGRTLGLAGGHPIDWSSYYVRTGGVLPECRDRALATELLRGFEAPLVQKGVARITVDTASANAPMVRALTTLGYVVTGTSASERWGALLHWTKFLSAAPKAVFMRQFCPMSFDHVALGRGSDLTTRRE